MIEKKGLFGIFSLGFVLGVITLIQLKLFNPELANFHGLLDSILQHNLAAVFYVCFLVSFIFLSYIAFIMGWLVIYSATIGRAIGFIKNIAGYNSNNYHYEYYTGESYEMYEIIGIFVYIVCVIPLMLYILFPALSALLGLIFLVYLVCQLLNG